MREVFIEKGDDLLRVAIKEDGELVECFIDEYSTDPQIGEIYIGRVKNIVSSINSMFVDIGCGKEAYMYYDDNIRSEGIKKGDEILVEVLKDPIGDKGAKVTKRPSIVGKNIVITLGENGVNFSKKILNTDRIQELKKYINPVKGFGITVRTNADEVSDIEILDEIEFLLNKFNILKNKLTYGVNLGKVYGEDLILKKIFLDKVEDDTKIITNSSEIYDYAKTTKKLVEVKTYTGTRNLFDYYSIEKEIIKLRHNKVVLNCGGNIVIEKTEAMYVIDVNSAKNTKCRDFNKTILETNLEAAEEIGKQIKLRNLSGIIVVDFIDMRDKRQKSIVFNKLKKALELDKGNVKVFPFTELDLIQITRKRLGKSIYQYLETSCSKCEGRGVILKLSYIKNLIKNEIFRCKNENSINSFYIELDKIYEESVNGDKYSFLRDIEALEEEVYINFVETIEGYKLEPIIFQKQKQSIIHLLMKPYEKY